MLFHDRMKAMTVTERALFAFILTAAIVAPMTYITAFQPPSRLNMIWFFGIPLGVSLLVYRGALARLRSFAALVPVTALQMIFFFFFVFGFDY